MTNEPLSAYVRRCRAQPPEGPDWLANEIQVLEDALAHCIARESKLAAMHILVGDSVYEDAQVTIRDGWLHIEFDADDLDSIALDLRCLTETKQ